MDEGLIRLVLACAAFVGSHFLLSGPLRRPFVRGLGERGFSVVYSLLAIGLMVWIAAAFHGVPRGEGLWNGISIWPWTIASVLTYVAVVFVVGSLAGNPALPQAKLAGLSARKPWGAFRVTRHPMMFGIALWAVAHVIIAPTARTALLCAAMIVLAIGGSALQDRRKLAMSPREWGVWMQRTRFWPDLTRLREFGGGWIVGFGVWLLVTLAHRYGAGMPAGIWLWVN
jgi:uncharacterized membrane protein